MLGALAPSVGAFHIRNVVMRCCQKSLMIPGILLFGLVLADSAAAQWVNRYSRLSDFNHHTYLEQHELPILAHGPTDPAPAPDGQTLAMAARGWIWQLDLATGKATQLTNGPAVDSRPRWSPDGQQLAIVRDNGNDTAIVILNVENGQEQVINTPTIELDPEFSADGQSLYYTSGVGDKLSLWQRHLASGVDTRLTDLPQVERNARRLPSGDGLVYLHGDGPHRVLRERDFVAGTDAIVHAETLTLSPDRRYPSARTLDCLQRADRQRLPSLDDGSRRSESHSPIDQRRSLRVDSGLQRQMARTCTTWKPMMLASSSYAVLPRTGVSRRPLTFANGRDARPREPFRLR
ncbi:MAG: hypothetical protein U5K38_13150 [Woeseiaceae bacterium]|nr:hypothetical protein [Woeseiaceae bacterium]